jgi:hypothetical protein
MRTRARVPNTITLQELLKLPGGSAVVEQWQRANAPKPIYNLHQVRVALEVLSSDEPPSPAALAQIGAPLLAYLNSTGRAKGSCRDFLEKAQGEILDGRPASKVIDNGSAIATNGSETDTSAGDAQEQEGKEISFSQRRQRKPITDPDILAKRNAALAKARATRAEKLALARIGSAPGSDQGSEPTLEQDAE